MAEGCEIAVIETGMGGRIDATNVLARPELAVLTAVSFDHTAVLGSSLAAIAREKSGILKPGWIWQYLFLSRLRFGRYWSRQPKRRTAGFGMPEKSGWKMCRTAWTGSAGRCRGGGSACRWRGRIRSKTSARCGRPCKSCGGGDGICRGPRYRRDFPAHGFLPVWNGSGQCRCFFWTARTILPGPRCWRSLSAVSARQARHGCGGDAAGQTLCCRDGYPVPLFFRAVCRYAGLSPRPARPRAGRFLARRDTAPSVRGKSCGGIAAGGGLCGRDGGGCGMRFPVFGRASPPIAMGTGKVCRKNYRPPRCDKIIGRDRVSL